MADLLGATPPFVMTFLLSFLLRMAERSLALIFVALLLPVLLLVALLVWSTSEGQVLLTDDWHCHGGKRARSHRFRTTGDGTPGFRRVGWFLRRYALDDLPGLWDVACGDLRLKDLIRITR